jgi:hypothetical protein
VLLFVVALCGCGLTDYEAKMLAAQKRAQRLEEEFKNLDEPVAIPTRKENEVETPLANVFFRPPRGIGPTAAANPLAGLVHFYLPRQPVAVHQPGTPVAPPPISDVLAVGLAFATNRQDFANEVLRTLTASDQVTRTRREVRSPGRPAATVYDILEFDDMWHSYSIYVSASGPTQVAVVYRMAKGRRGNVSGPLTLSLESLALDADANRARQAYARQPRVSAGTKK